MHKATRTSSFCIRRNCLCHSKTLRSLAPMAAQDFLCTIFLIPLLILLSVLAKHAPPQGVGGLDESAPKIRNACRNRKDLDRAINYARLGKTVATYRLI